MQADGLSARGGAFPWLQGSSPALGLIYRRGTYASLPNLTIAATDATASESPGNPGAFRVTRTGPTERALPFSFVLTGQAQNAADFAVINLSGQIAAGSSSADIVVTPVDDAASEGNELAICTLSEALDYTLSVNPSAQC